MTTYLHRRCTIRTTFLNETKSDYVTRNRIAKQKRVWKLLKPGRSLSIRMDCEEEQCKLQYLLCDFREQFGRYCLAFSKDFQLCFRVVLGMLSEIGRKVSSPLAIRSKSSDASSHICVSCFRAGSLPAFASSTLSQNFLKPAV
jgi:hypothetical protein